MATASPTPMGSSHFASLSRRPSSRQIYKRPISRSSNNRGDAISNIPVESRARTYSLNDSSDDDIPPPMRFSALTNALLNDSAPSADKSLPTTARTTPEPENQEGFQFRAGGSGNTSQDRISPPDGKLNSPYPRRVVRLSGTPGSSTLRRAGSLSSAVKRRNEQLAAKAEDPQDLSTPEQLPRTVRIPITTSGNQWQPGSSARASREANSASRNEDRENAAPEYPTTVGRSQLATSQGSVSRYGSSTIGRPRYGEEPGQQSSMRFKGVSKVRGAFLLGPARRGRRRMDDEDQSPVEEQGSRLEAAGSSQEPQSQESQEPESQPNFEADPSQEPGDNRVAAHSSAYRDFNSGSPISSKDILNPVLRSTSPPPPTLSSAQRSIQEASKQRAAIQPVQPVFKVPAPRPDLPSNHDQENEAPPTFKKNKQAPLIHLDKMEKVSTRPESMDMSALRTGSPERRPLAPRSQNTPRRPAPPPPKMSILEAATSTAGAATTSTASRKRNTLKVNGKIFTRLDCIGRGGSSRVYRVMAENSRFLALKRVSLADADEAAVRGFKGEIDLLRKLEGVERVIRLYDYELNEEKGTLSVLMEMGELDMMKMLDLRLKTEQAKFDQSFVRHYWKEMLECLQAIHEHDIVHSDLKPHNFVLVQGRLKLIDFGIANAIQTDETVNVHRETQIGTPNYMSPESLMDSNSKPDSRGRIPNEPKLMKLGKPSDIWSLGCILYQMVYGRAPFAHIQNPMQRCQTIINFNYAIEYPSLGVGNVPVPSSLIKTLKRCLNRDQHQRPSATELLNEKDPFLNPVEYDSNALPITEELLGRILLNVAAKIKDRAPTDAELLTAWPQGYFERLRKNIAEGKAL
ncbi:kinase-like domain-containing protein [Tricladium varicosporioides]|nr:kinase-like domain-containing protein [Hymenoscyphus varicosporioides]